MTCQGLGSPCINQFWSLWDGGGEGGGKKTGILQDGVLDLVYSR